MADTKQVTHVLADIRCERIAKMTFPYDQVNGQRVFRRAHAPDVEIMQLNPWQSGMAAERIF